MSEIRTRFAPSPTGFMHVGNLRTALYAWLLARSEKGKFILRIEDTDQARYVANAVEVIYATLKSAGLDHDEGPDKDGGFGPYIQSERRSLYRQYAEQLVASGHAYYCFCDKCAEENEDEIHEASSLCPCASMPAAEAAAKRIAGAFGKGVQMGSKGTGNIGQGIQGSPTGNAAEGKSSGIGGYGTFDLNGRSLGPGGLPMPVYNVQEEGRVVVTITVNPAGQVIQTSINKRTNTANAALRKAAEDAARKARFNAVSGVNNQTGTITYYFKLK